VTETTPPTPPVEPEPGLAVPEGIRKARAHLRADLPALPCRRPGPLRRAGFGEDAPSSGELSDQGGYRCDRRGIDLAEPLHAVPLIDGANLERQRD
jgi:hypothetical protein